MRFIIGPKFHFGIKDGKLYPLTWRERLWNFIHRLHIPVYKTKVVSYDARTKTVTFDTTDE